MPSNSVQILKKQRVCPLECLPEVRVILSKYDFYNKFFILESVDDIQANVILRKRLFPSSNSKTVPVELAESHETIHENDQSSHLTTSPTNYFEAYSFTVSKDDATLELVLVSNIALNFYLIINVFSIFLQNPIDSNLPFSRIPVDHLKINSTNMVPERLAKTIEDIKLTEQIDQMLENCKKSKVRI